MRRRRLARPLLAAALLCAAALPTRGAAQSPAHRARPAPAELLLRVDDIGMNHSVNMALADVAALGVPVSASVLFACPWYQEAVEILRRNPQIAVGVHLALNSEWKGYRWGPVLGASAVPSLVDSVGYFRSSSEEFLAHPYDLGEVEHELSAQVERARRTGLRVAYVDYHMGTAVATPALRQVVERVAARYGLGISRYFGEAYHTMFDTPVADKERALVRHVAGLTPGTLNLVVLHVARATPEMLALVDMNNAAQNTAGGAPLVARHRQAELDALRSPAFARLRATGRVALVGYDSVAARRGLAAMRPPP